MPLSDGPEPPATETTLYDGHEPKGDTPMSTTVEASIAEQEIVETAETEQPNEAEGDGLFDRSQYDREDLQIAKIDGQTIDKIRVRFSGSVMLDRSDPADVSLYNRLTMGRDCELRCAGKVSAAGGSYTTNREGDLDAVVGEKSVKVETVWVLEPENL